MLQWIAVSLFWERVIKMKDEPNEESEFKERARKVVAIEGRKRAETERDAAILQRGEALAELEKLSMQFKDAWTLLAAINHEAVSGSLPAIDALKKIHRMYDRALAASLENN